MRALQAPLPASQLVLAAALIALAVIAYCLAYTAYSGERETIGEAALWTLVNVLPWLAAFEAAKRFERLGSKMIVLAAVACASTLLGLALGQGDEPTFELVRRVPGLVACALLVVTAGWRPGAAHRGSAATRELPLPLHWIDWISSAGNYVELHGTGRTVVHRCSLARMEVWLGRDGFVRVHRTALVRRDRIARVRAQDVILKDGTSVKIGKRYRSALAGLNLVPSSRPAGSTPEGRSS